MFRAFVTFIFYLSVYINIMKMPQNVALNLESLKGMSQLLFFAVFLHVTNRNGFYVPANVHEMAINL